MLREFCLRLRAGQRQVELAEADAALADRDDDQQPQRYDQQAVDRQSDDEQREGGARTVGWWRVEADPRDGNKHRRWDEPFAVLHPL